jgi:hypothetical protein
MSNLLKANNKLLKHCNTWAEFDGVSSRIYNVATTAYLAWMNSGIFNMQFDYIAIGTTAGRVVCTAVSSTSKGFQFVYTSNVLTLYYSNGSGTYAFISPRTIVQGTSYHITLQGNGTQIRYTIKNNDTGAVHYAGPWTSCLYAAGNMTYTLSFSSYGSTANYTKCKLRNFKIFTDTDGTILFLFLPMQDSNAVSQDVIGGVSGTVVNVSVVNKLETERWAYFDGVSSNLSIGTTSTLGWMNSGTFNVQFDLKLLKAPTASAVHIYTSSAAVHYGFFFQFITNGQIRLYWCNGTGVYAIGMSAMDVCVLGTNYHYLLQGNGTQIRLYVVNSDTGANFYDSGWVSCNYVPNATMYFPLVVGRNAYNAQFQLKNFTIYSDTNGTQPFFSLPFQNPDAIAVDTIGGLVGTNNNVILINNMANILKS